jgi:hypothetical protein
MLIIPTIWEVVIGGPQFEAILGKKVSENLYLKNKLGMVVQACNPSYSGGIGRIMV